MMTKELQQQLEDPLGVHGDHRRQLVVLLNKIIRGQSLYDSERFEWVELRDKTKELLDEKPQGASLKRLNQMLLEDALPKILSKSSTNRMMDFTKYNGGIIAGPAIILVGSRRSVVSVEITPNEKH